MLPTSLWLPFWFGDTWPALLLILATHHVVGVMALWAGLGRPHWFLRVAVLGGVLAVGFTIPAPDLILLFLVQSVTVAAPLLLARWWWLGWPGAPPDPGEARRRGGQFSLADLLLLTVIIAAMAAFLVSLRRMDYWPMQEVVNARTVWEALWGTLLLGVVLALSTLVADWAALGHRHLWLRLVLLCLLPLSVLTAMWLAIVRLSRPSAGCHEHSAPVGCHGRLARPCPEPPDHGLTRAGKPPVAPKRWTRYAARGIAVVLALVLLIPLGAVYVRLANPPPIPEAAMPADNGYPALLRAAGAMEHAIIPHVDTATEREADARRVFSTAFDGTLAADLRFFSTTRDRTLAEARAALARPCRVTLQWRPGAETFVTDPMRLIALAEEINREGYRAAWDGRSGDALRWHLDSVRLGPASSRGGLVWDTLSGWWLSGCGKAGIVRMRDQLTAEQCRAAIRTVRQIEREFEPLEDVLVRHYVWEEYAYGWVGRIKHIDEALTGDSVAADSDRAALKREQTWTELLAGELAIRQYRLRHGKLPDRLADLVPEFLEAEPHDYCSGKPLVYRRTAGGYRLYSVGPDGEDNGGVSTGPGGEWYDDISFDEPPAAPADDKGAEEPQ